MAYFKITQPNQPPKWIKSIDRANGTLEFSTDRDGCFQQDSGFFADSEAAYLKFHFTEAYPELEYMTIDTSWNPNGIEEDVAMQIHDDPMPIQGNGINEAINQAIIGEPIIGEPIMEENGVAEVEQEAEAAPW